MKNYEKVLLVIKMECENQKQLAEVDCFDDIAKKAEIPRQKLPVILNELQGKGFIKYSFKEKFVYLTKEGRDYVK